MKVVIAHDYLTQRGGAERVVLELARAFPEASILTSMYAPDVTFPEFRDLHVTTLALDRFGSFRRDPRRALPFLGEAFRRHYVDADLVLASSSGFAHQVRSRGPKVVYCHNPPRWLHQWEDYSIGLGLAERLAFRALRRRLLTTDRRGAREAAGYVANSNNVAQRIRSAYGIEPVVIHPPRGLDPDGPTMPVPGLRPGFLLTVGRPRGYKRTDLLLETVARMPDQTLVTVGSRPDPRWPANIQQLRDIPDAQLRWLYRSASALLACSREDFGLTPVEAFGFGTPVGATPEGGYLETCLPGLTGDWLDAGSVASMEAGVRALLDRHWDPAAIRQHGEKWTAEVFRRNLTQTVAGILARQ